jgi:hypothetical protein
VPYHSLTDRRAARITRAVAGCHAVGRIFKAMATSRLVFTGGKEAMFEIGEFQKETD